MQRFTSHLITLATLFTCTFSAHSDAHAMSSSLIIEVEPKAGLTCTELTVTSSDLSLNETILLSDMSERQGVYTSSLSLREGDHTIRGWLTCKEGLFMIRRFQLSLSYGQTLVQPLRVVYRMPICDDMTNHGNLVSGLYDDVSYALRYLEASLQFIGKDKSSADLALLEVECALNNVKSVLKDITINQKAELLCEFYACHNAPDVAVDGTFVHKLLSLKDLGLSNVNTSDPDSIPVISNAIQVLKKEKTRLGAETYLLKIAKDYQCDYKAELNLLLGEQEWLAWNAAYWAPQSKMALWQIYYKRFSQEISRIARAAGCEPILVNGCDHQGVCPSIESQSLAQRALSEVQAAYTELKYCAP